MQSNNPVFRRSEEFNRGGANMYGNQTYAGNGSPMGGYGQTDPSQWSVGTPGARGPRARPPRGPMTIDSVVQKTAITLGAGHRRRAGDLDPDPGGDIDTDSETSAPLFAAVTHRLAGRLRPVDGQLVQAQ